MKFNRLQGMLFLPGLILFLVIIPAVTAQEEPCIGEIECYEPPPATGGAPPEVKFVPEQPWEGFSDGRLNPDMAEYYSVYCPQGSLVIMVLRAVPPPTALVDNVPIENVSDGATFTRESSGLTVARSGDAVTISGSNGNLAPQSGSKTFSFAECLERAGITLEEQPEASPNTGDNSTSSGSDSPPRNANPVATLINLIVQYGELLCPGSSGLVGGVFTLPGALTWMRRRKRQ